MKKNLFLLLGLNLMAFTPTLNAQATGNETYNDNNRFKNNGFYKTESMSAPPAAARYDDGYLAESRIAGNADMKNKRKMANSNAQYYQAGMETSQGDLLLNQVQNNQSSYYDGSDFLVRVHVLYNASPSSYMAIFHLNQAGKKVQDIDSLMGKRVAKLIQQSQSIGLKKRISAPI